MSKLLSRSHLCLAASLRRRYPIAPVLIPMLLGQMLGHFWWSVWVLSTILLMVGVRWVAARPSIGVLARCRFWLFLSAGILSMLLSFPNRWSRVPGEQLIIGTVDETPRFPKVGEVLMAVMTSYGQRILLKGKDLPWSNASSAEIGDSVQVIAKVELLPDWPLPLSYEATLRRHGFSAQGKIKYITKSLNHAPPFFEDAKKNLFVQVRTAFTDDSITNLFLSLTLGSRDGVSDGILESFKRTGLMHLLVFSGCQVVSVFMTVKALARSSIIAVIAATLLVLLVGVDPSSFRALMALVLVMLAHAWERRSGFAHAIMVGLFLTSLAWPGSFLEPDVDLTFAALFGISLGLTVSAKLTPISKLGVLLWVSLYVWATTTFITLLWFGTCSLAGIFLNPLVAPLVSFVITQGGLISLFAFGIGVDPRGRLISLMLPPVSQLVSITEYVSQLPLALANLGWVSRLGLASALLFAIMYSVQVRVRRIRANPFL